MITMINEIYEDDTAGPYFIRILRRIPTSLEEGWDLTWSGIARYHLNKSRKKTDKWNLLKERLLDKKLIEEQSGKIVIRKFI